MEDLNLNALPIYSGAEASLLWGKDRQYVKTILKKYPERFPAGSIRKIGHTWIVTKEGMEAVTGKKLEEVRMNPSIKSLHEQLEKRFNGQFKNIPVENIYYQLGELVMYVAGRTLTKKSTYADVYKIGFNTSSSVTVERLLENIRFYLRTRDMEKDFGPYVRYLESRVKENNARSDILSDRVKVEQDDMFLKGIVITSSVMESK